MDIKVRDSNGALLAEGDSVTLIKDLKLKGSSTVLKRGTMIRNIHLTDNEDEIEGRTDKIKGLNGVAHGPAIEHLAHSSRYGSKPAEQILVSSTCGDRAPRVAFFDKGVTVRTTVYRGRAEIQMLSTSRT